MYKNTAMEGFFLETVARYKDKGKKRKAIPVTGRVGP
jgi:hypothetical protein